MTKVVTQTYEPYAYSAANVEYRIPGRASLPFTVTTVPGPDPDPEPEPTPGYPARFGEGSEPWRIRPDETVTHMSRLSPTIQTRDAKLYGGTGGGDLEQIATNIAASIPTGQCATVLLDYGTYHLTKLIDHNNNVNNPNPIGVVDKGRKIIGFVGKPRIYDSFGQVTAETIVQVDETMISSTPGMVNYAVSRVKPGLNAITAMYFSNANTTINNIAVVPREQFWSGITFDGTPQIPFTTFTTAAQAGFARNHGVPAPLPWNGLTLIRPKAGSIFQFCRFRGFSAAYTSAPPYESGTVGTNYSEGLHVWRCEVDGRVAAHINPARPRMSGGFMQNKDGNITFEDFYEHHTARSGNAFNDNTGNENAVITYINMQQHDIANITASFPYPSDAGTLPGGFNCWNLEAMVGTVRIINCRANGEHGHINWVVPKVGSSGRQYTAPNRVAIYVWGFRTDDTRYGGCLRITIGSRSSSPVQDKIVALGIDGSGLFDVRWNVGDTVPMSGVRASVWNARQASQGDAAEFYPKHLYFVVDY